MPRENTRAHTRAFSSLPRRRYCPPLLHPFSPPPSPCVLYKFPDHAPTSRQPPPSRKRPETYFQNTLHVRSHGTLSEEVSREPASDSTLRFNFYVGLTSFLLTRLPFRSPLIEHVLINHATLIRVAVNSSDEHYGHWFFTGRYAT